MRSIHTSLVVPAGDEGWLCPACDCKIDCIDIINELQGTDLSINDSWEVTVPLLRIQVWLCFITNEPKIYSTMTLHKFCCYIIAAESIS
jgi:hypothetical protein